RSLSAASRVPGWRRWKEPAIRCKVIAPSGWPSSSPTSPVRPADRCTASAADRSTTEEKRPMSIELDHSFTVPVPPARAWDVLIDLAGIAPCMPGATVEELDGDVVTERDPEARQAVVEATGKEMRGADTASANIRAALEPDGDGTRVAIHTVMNV